MLRHLAIAAELEVFSQECTLERTLSDPITDDDLAGALDHRVQNLVNGLKSMQKAALDGGARGSVLLGVLS